MERVMKSIKALIITTILVAALTTCSNPFNWVAEVSDEVMMAKDMYLQIESTTPKNSADSVDPWRSIDVAFDREIDLTSVSTSSIDLSPSVEWTYTYNTSTDTLTIKPTALGSEVTYTVKITSGLRGTDASSLRDPFAWSFKTAKAPGGSISIAGTTYGDTKYCKSENITVAIYYNQVVDSYRISTVDPPTQESDWSGVIAVDGTSPDMKTAPASFNALPLGDGVKRVYVRYWDDGDGIESPPTEIYDTVVLDKTVPTVSVGTFPALLHVVAPSVTPGATASDANGIKTYLWTQSAGAAGAVTFSSTSTLNPTISGSSDYTTGVQVRLRATDPAGNYTDSTSTSMTVDCVAPAAPSVTDPSSPTTDTTPTWTWVSGGGGNGYYQYQFDDGSWSAETTSLTATLSISDSEYGSHSFRVKERDAAGNWSAENSDSLFIYPSYLLPEQPFLIIQKVDCSPLIQWAASSALYTTWDVWWKKSNELRFTREVAGTTSYQVQLPKGALDPDSTYYWYFVKTRLGVTTRYPAGSQFFTFHTNNTP